jgi:hypothetical protein
MVKKSFVVVIITLLPICSFIAWIIGSHYHQPSSYLILQNNQLIEGIREYKASLKHFKQPEENTCIVYYYHVCDSIERYVVSASSDPDEIKEYPIFFRIQLDGEEVFFSIVQRNNVGINTFFSMPSSAYKDYVKLNFPQTYQSLEQRDAHFKVNMELSGGPKLLYMTFLGDSLIDKTLKPGLPEDDIPVMLNGKEVYL